MLLGKSLQTLHGNKVQLDEVPFCNSILLWNIPADTSKEDIEFEIRRIMGPNSIDNISYNDGDEFAIVTFKMTGMHSLSSYDLRPIYTRSPEVAGCSSLQLVATFLQCLHMKNKCESGCNKSHEVAILSAGFLDCFEAVQWNLNIANSEGNQKICPILVCLHRRTYGVKIN